MDQGSTPRIYFIIQIIDIDETTGLPVLGEGSVKVYPNPFSHSTTISFPNPEGKSYRIVLTDLSGKVCRILENITTSEYMLEKENLLEGFYIIELKGPKTFRSKCKN